MNLGPNVSVGLWHDPQLLLRTWGMGKRRRFFNKNTPGTEQHLIFLVNVG